MKLNDNEKVLLASVLISTDVLFLPFRFTRSNQAAAVAALERRISYARNGHPIVGGGNAVQRKAHERRLTALSKQGLLDVNRSGTRSVFVRLSVYGDNCARSMLPSCRVDDAWPILEKIRAVELEFGGKTNAGFTAEHDILGIGTGPIDDPKQFTDFEDCVLPLLCRGYVESWGDTVGIVGYKTTDAGRAALENGPPDPGDMPAYCAGMADAFIEQYHTECEARKSWRPSAFNHVALPLSAGMWPKRPEGSSAP